MEKKKRSTRKPPLRTSRNYLWKVIEKEKFFLFPFLLLLLLHPLFFFRWLLFFSISFHLLFSFFFFCLFFFSCFFAPLAGKKKRGREEGCSVCCGDHEGCWLFPQATRTTILISPSLSISIFLPSLPLSLFDSSYLFSFILTFSTRFPPVRFVFSVSFTFLSFTGEKKKRLFFLFFALAPLPPPFASLPLGVVLVPRFLIPQLIPSQTRKYPSCSIILFFAFFFFFFYCIFSSKRSYINHRTPEK